MSRKSFIHIALFLAVFFAFSCSEKPGFTIEGTLSDGEGKVLYLENIGPNSLTLVDSVKVDKNQNFRFRGENQSGAPDFYRVRLKNQFVNLVVDSTETIVIKADTLRFAKNYSVEGSPENEIIKELTLLQIQTNIEYNKIRRELTKKAIAEEEAFERSEVLVNNYKNKAREYIITNPASAAAYFALFQQVNNLLIFDPYDKNDSKFFGAVANNWNVAYPEAPRTQHLIGIFKNSLNAIRKQDVEIDPKEVTTMEAFDFSLPSVNNVEYKLSEVAEGRVLLLDFTAYELAESPAHTLQLTAVYEQYRDRGFEIFQISLDSDLHFWKNAAVNLPWICVNDPQSVYSELVSKFNVQNLPAGFLFNRSGEIVARIENFSKLEEEVKAIL